MRRRDAMTSFVLKGTVCYSKSPTELKICPNGYVVCVDGVSQGVFETLPTQFADLPTEDYGESLIVPGLVDLHLHAPQYAFRATGMDLELMDWLEKRAFPEEMRYADAHYADAAYARFAQDIKDSATTRAAVFATRHVPATEILMEKLEQSGIVSYVGKVNMDIGGPTQLLEESAEASARATVQWLADVAGKWAHTKPILTPRFIPSCSRELLEKLETIRAEYDLPVQSHLSENPEEIKLVGQLFPEEESYGHCYERYGLMRENTIMAHCVYSSETERQLLKKRGVFLAHCPTSNTNLSSGIAPIRAYLRDGLRVGLGTDVAGGHSLSMFRAVTDAIEVSKLYWRMVDASCKPLCFEEAFYLATCGGGAFFGRVGSFEAGYAFDALVLREEELPYAHEMSARDRLERFAYLERGRASLRAKYADGRKLF